MFDIEILAKMIYLLTIPLILKSFYAIYKNRQKAVVAKLIFHAYTLLVPLYVVFSIFWVFETHTFVPSVVFFVWAVINALFVTSTDLSVRAMCKNEQT